MAENVVPAKGSSKAKPLIVMKFGGTSVGNAERMERVAEILREHASHAEIVVVVSAMGGVTDMLIRAATEASRGDREHWKGVRQELARRHREVADRLLSAGEQAAVLPRLAEHVSQFENLCSGFSLVREVTPRGMDTLSSLGEVMSATLVAAILRSKGLPAEAVDAMECIVTDEHFGNATPLFAETDLKTSERLAPLRRRGAIPVVTGFRGATREGLCTTLGRGGSDYSGTIVGAALDAEEIWIWTDVDGVMTADPRLVPAARIIPEISYREAIELSFFGAKVLHPKTIQPVMKKKIPVWIKNSFNPACPGTKIGPAAANGQPGVKAITSVSKADLITISGKDTMSFAQLASKVFGALSLEGITTLMVTQSSADNVLCFAVHNADLKRVKTKLEKVFELEILHDYMAALEVMPHVAMVVAIGENMKGTPGIAGRAFSALGSRGINIIAIAQGSSELSISFAVKSADVKEAVQAIHEEFQL
ncbi:MAG TPA: aspartate kinase [Terriglobia bacterium]|nr:aspartate kinase [Terriglobia bacterium]